MNLDKLLKLGVVTSGSVLVDEKKNKEYRIVTVTVTKDKVEVTGQVLDYTTRKVEEFKLDKSINFDIVKEVKKDVEEIVEKTKDVVLNVVDDVKDLFKDSDKEETKNIKVKKPKKEQEPVKE